MFIFHVNRNNNNISSLVSFQQDYYESPTPPKIDISPEEKNSLQTRLLALTRGNSVLPNYPLCSQEKSSSTLNLWKAEINIPTPPLPLLYSNNDCNETVADIPLTDREKRCLAVPIDDILDKKRKLIRSRSTITPQKNR